jgi:predicted aconitase with swiveling domain
VIEFKGRVLISGQGFGEAVVARKTVSQIKAFGKRAENTSKKLLFADRHFKDIYKKNLTGKVFVLPSFKASDINSMVLLSMAKKKIEPKCFLFSQKLDAATVAAFTLAKTYLNSEVVVIDSLGDEFLQTVETGDQISFADEYVVLNL